MKLLPAEVADADIAEAEAADQPGRDFRESDRPRNAVTLESPIIFKKSIAQAK
ncbi:hypothetical protein [Nocardia aurea]|uniref:hypothetical protein n=1 Tax=Nocardia aurea TaxID=2144174 RepID=UPI0033BB9634